MTLSNTPLVMRLQERYWQPRLAFEGFVAFDLTLTQGADGEAPTLCFAPPTHAGEGKAPQDRFIFVAQKDFPSARAILQGSEVDRTIGEVSWGGSEPPSGTAGGYPCFF